MLPSKVNASNIYSVWRKVNNLGYKITHCRVKFNVGDLVRIKKEKVKFANWYENTFTTVMYRFVKVI